MFSFKNQLALDFSKSFKFRSLYALIFFSSNVLTTLRTVSKENVFVPNQTSLMLIDLFIFHEKPKGESRFQNKSSGWLIYIAFSLWDTNGIHFHLFSLEDGNVFRNYCALPSRWIFQPWIQNRVNQSYRYYDGFRLIYHTCLISIDHNSSYA